MNKKLIALWMVAAVLLALAGTIYAQAPSGETKVRWLGQSAFEVVTPGGKTIFIDPWITGNPQAPVKVENIEKADLILVTHDHFDHLGDSVAIAKKTEGVVIASFELLKKLVSEGLPERNALNGGNGMNIGGTVKVRGISVTMVLAFHTGTPCGYVITLENGKRMYHAGDTCVFGDMGLIRELYPLDLALVPIGDTFTMGGYQAAHAVDLLQPRAVIPMHYKSFPLLAQDAADFVRHMRKAAPNVEVVVLEPGEEYRF